MVRDLPLAIAAIASVLTAQPAWAQLAQPIADIPRLNQIKPPFTTAEELLVQQPAPTPAQAQVTGVQLKPIDKGLEVILETAGTFDEVLTSSSDNSLITDIPNAQLRLPKGEAFRQDNPTQDIASVEVTNLDAKTIRVTVTGKAGVPTAEVSQSERALVLSVAPPPAPAPQPTPTPTPPPATPAPTEPPPAEAQPEAQTEEEELLELEVTAEQEVGGYRVPDSTTATKTDTPLRDIPASIQVVPRQLLEDRQITRVQQVAEDVPGVQVDVTQGGLPATEFFIRGFNSFLTTYRDGFRSAAFGSLFNVANIEQVEVLKGPASVLYGQNEPGGIVNIVSKQPLTQPFYSPSLTIGSFDFYRPTLDISGLLNSQETVAYRLNLAYENAGSFRDFVNSENIFVAPVLSWQIGEDTKLTFNFEYQKFDFTYDRGFGPAGPEIFQVPISRNLGEPDFGDGDAETGRTSYVLEHQFSKNWKLRNGFAAVISSFDKSEVTPLFLQEDRRTIDRTAAKENQSSQDFTLQNEVVGTFQTGSVAHQVLLGVELYRQRSTVESLGAEIAPIDLFDPVYGAKPGLFSPDQDDESISNTLGIYFQDQIALLSNLKLLLGGRFDLIRSLDNDLLNDQETDQTDFAFSPRTGIVYQPIEPVSLYFSYATSFNPALGFSAAGESFQPERGEQFEAGVKADLLPEQLFATLAGYQITKQNVLVTDPDDPDFSIQTGEQKSRGMELSLVGRPLPGLDITLGYAYTDAFVSEDEDPAFVGGRLTSIPRHQIGLWSSYEFQIGALRGFGAGLGLYYVSGDREALLPNTDLRLPGYFRVDTSVFYRRDNWKVQLNVNNLTNIDYYNSNGFFVVPQPPLTVLGSVSVEF